MVRYRWAAATVLAASFLTVPSADACPTYIQPRLADARQADAVVVGYVTKDVRETSPERNAIDRARLTVQIDHAITGTTPSTVTVYWYRMTNNGPPDHINGGYVFSLRRNIASTSGDAPDTYAVMQGICSGALVFRRGSPEANAIREMSGLWPEPLEVPRKTVLESVSDLSTQWPTLVGCGLLAAGAAIVGLIAFWPRRRLP